MKVIRPERSGGLHKGHDHHDRNLSKRLFFARLPPAGDPAKTFWQGRQ
jgi:hypothetical protein